MSFKYQRFSRTNFIIYALPEAFGSPLVICATIYRLKRNNRVSSLHSFVLRSVIVCDCEILAIPCHYSPDVLFFRGYPMECCCTTFYAENSAKRIIIRSWCLETLRRASGKVMENKEVGMRSGGWKLEWKCGMKTLMKIYFGNIYINIKEINKSHKKTKEKN